jgi:RNA polymerase sigma-70 factor (ECF subfamily)
LVLLYRQMRKLAGPRPDLEDLVQAAAERALRAWPRYEGRARLSTWSYGVAYRTFLDHERWYRRWRRRFSSVEEPAERELADGPDGEAAAIEVARARSLHRALGLLPAPKRAVVVLHDLEGLDLAEVAAIVGANERTVRSRLRDARHRLLTLLKSDPLFDPEVSA